jgi:ribose-phosphate pyrophosphokinase
VVHSVPLLSDWIGANVPRPLIVGPDIESEQWAGAVATAVNAPHVTLNKTRGGDRLVDISVPDLSPSRGLTPVLIDDIVSTARTMIEASRQLVAQGLPAPVCVAVHALFAPEAYDALRKAAARVVTTNTVPHPSNAIDVFSPVAAEVVDLLGVDSRI